MTTVEQPVEQTMERQSPFTVTAQSPVALGAALRELGRERAVYFDEFLRQWVVLRNADIRAALYDTETFDNTAIYGAARVSIPGPVSLTGAEHAAARQAFTKFFSARAVAGYEENAVRPVAEELVGSLRGRTELELVGEFALRFPIMVVSRLFGIPDELTEQTEELTRTLVAGVLALKGEHQVVAARKAVDDFYELLRPFVDQEIASPSEGLLGRIIQGLYHEGSGTVQDCLEAAVSLVIAGYETTNWTIASLLSALLLNPDTLAEVRADRTLIPGAIEDGMRWGGTVIGINRLVTRPITLGGIDLDPGTVVLLSFSAAHLDEQLHPDPERFDPRRPDKSHLLFSAGPHFCLGAPLARLEARVGLSTLLDAFPVLRLDPDRMPTFRFGTRGSFAYGPDALHTLTS